MDKKTHQQIKEKFEKEKERLEAQLSSFAKRSSKNSDDYDARFPQFGDKDDENAAEVETYSTNLTLERTLESALRDINKALGRMKDGTYGVCKYCNENIDPKRLMARPTSTSCINCKKRLTQEA